MKTPSSYAGVDPPCTVFDPAADSRLPSSHCLLLTPGYIQTGAGHLCPQLGALFWGAAALLSLPLNPPPLSAQPGMSPLSAA